MEGKRLLAVVMMISVMFAGCQETDINNKDSETKSKITSTKDISGLIELEAETKDVSNVTFVAEEYMEDECRQMYKLLMQSQINKNVTYKKDDIIDGIRAVNAGDLFSLMSRAIDIRELKRYLPIDNVKKIDTNNNVTFLIEYPMEDCTFVVVVAESGRIKGTYMQAKELRSEDEMGLLFEGMKLEDVNKIYPEIIISPTGNKIISDDISIEEFPECTVALKNRSKVTVSFRQAGNGYEIAEIVLSDNIILSEEEWKALNENEGKISQQETGLVLLENKIIQGENLWNEFVLKSKMKEPCSITIKNYSISSPSISSLTLIFDGEFYSTDKLVSGEQGKKYRFLVERSGQLKSAKYKEHGFYLVNNENVTYEDLMWSALSSQSTDRIDFQKVYSDYK